MLLVYRIGIMDPISSAIERGVGALLHSTDSLCIDLTVLGILGKSCPEIYRGNIREDLEKHCDINCCSWKRKIGSSRTGTSLCCGIWVGLQWCFSMVVYVCIHKCSWQRLSWLNLNTSNSSSAPFWDEECGNNNILYVLHGENTATVYVMWLCNSVSAIDFNTYTSCV